MDLKLGEEMGDGAIAAGISLSTGQPIFIAGLDPYIAEDWVDAQVMAANYETPGYPKGSFRLPSAMELRTIFANRASIPGLVSIEDRIDPNKSMENYLSATVSEADHENILALNFRTGAECWQKKTITSMVCFVRDGYKLGR